MIWDISSYISLSTFLNFSSIIMHEFGHMLTAKVTDLSCSTMVIEGAFPIDSVHFKILNNYFFRLARYLLWCCVLYFSSFFLPFFHLF